SEQEEPELQQIYNASVQAGVEVDEASNIPVPLAFRRSLRFGKQAEIQPIKYLDGLARAFQDAGGAILTGIKVTGSRREDHVHHVETPAGNFRTAHLVYATHIPPGVNLLHFRCAPYRSYVLAARLSNQRYPADLAYDMKQPYHYFRTAGINGQQY